MSRMRMKLTLLVVALFGVLAFASPANAQEIGITNPNVSTPAKLYMHLLDYSNDFPINTQLPSEEYSLRTALGLATSSSSCVPENPAGPLTYGEHHKFYGYSSPSYVEYNVTEDGKPRTHPERGMSYDVQWDGSASFDLYWYLATMTGAPAAGANPDQIPLIVPNVVVEATIRSGDAISVDDKAYDTGEVLASGKTTPAFLAGPATPSVPNQSPNVNWTQATNGDQVYAFKVPMTIKTPVIPKETGYNLRIDVYLEDPTGTCPDADRKVMPNVVRIYTSPDFRPRMELSIMNPISIEYLHPQFVGDDLVVHTSSNSPWGNYDVNEQSSNGIQVTVEGPSPATSLARAAIVQRYHEHYFHQQAVDITYVWPYKTDQALNGLYTVTFAVMNDQETATATAVAQFEIGKGTVLGCGGVQDAVDAQKQVNQDCFEGIQKDGQTQTKDTPGLELIGILGMLAAAVFVVRRRSA